MGRYLPGTLDDANVVARKEAKRSRAATAASMPSGSQMRGDSETLRKLSEDVEELKKDVKDKVDPEACVLPPGAVVNMRTNTNPADTGYPGEWEFLTQTHVPLTDIILFMYERTV